MAASIAAALASGACSEPPLPDGPVDDGDPGATPSAEPEDTRDDDLVRRVEGLRTAVAAASEELDVAASADALAAARPPVERALGVLLEDAGSWPAAGPLLPAETPERDESGRRDDLLSNTLAEAREVGGQDGTAVLDALREVAGDVGAWERDAAGVVAAIEGAATASDDLDESTADILELPGEASRALAWAMVARDADDTGTVTAAASRANAHLDLIQELLDDLQAELAGTSGDGGAA